MSSLTVKFERVDILAEAIIDKILVSLEQSSLADMYPAAHKELLAYRADMVADAIAVIDENFSKDGEGGMRANLTFGYFK
jgi:hypothetical protein